MINWQKEKGVKLFRSEGDLKEIFGKEFIRSSLGVLMNFLKDFFSLSSKLDGDAFKNKNKKLHI